MSDITFGGFFKSNIRKWIINECMTSGNPESFFWALGEVISDIEDEQQSNNSNFWENEEKKWRE